jgi:hypothetical protein
MAINFKHRRAYTAAQKDIVMQVLQLLRGLSNTEAAKECGLANSTVSKWRTRRTQVPSMASALKVATAMGCVIQIVEKEDEARDERRRAATEARVH